MTPERIEAIGEQLRDKITSKFTASTFLAGFALTVLTGQASFLWQAKDAIPPIFSLAVASVAAAFCLFIFAVIRLDELTMPKLFWEPPHWTSTDLPADDVSLSYSDLWQLKKTMVRIWVSLTIPATVITSVAVVITFLPNTITAVLPLQFRAGRLSTFVLVAVFSLAAIIYARRTNRPFTPD